MLFQRAGSKDDIKVKCTLVPLTEKANQDRRIYQTNAANEKVLQNSVPRRHGQARVLEDAEEAKARAGLLRVVEKEQTAAPPKRPRLRTGLSHSL